MTPWLSDADVTLYHGDVLATLRELPAESVDCVVTSPPYWGLRDYGQEGQLGLEPTPEQYVERMVEVFHEVRRVLAAHGTVWLNLGDSYASNWPCSRRNVIGEGSLENGKRENRPPRMSDGLKEKDLVGIPWRVAFALQADGWWLRSDIIWAKPNPMPESVTDRPTKAHEYVFLLSKQPRYFFDQEAVREAVSPHSDFARLNGAVGATDPLYDGEPGDQAAAPLRRVTPYGEVSGKAEGLGNGSRGDPSGRNIRSVWEIATQPYPEAHFATFPEELARRCIAAGCPEQVCRVCGKARERIVETNNPSLHAADDKTLGWANTHSKTSNAQSSKSLHRNPGGVYSSAVVKGWTDCGHADYRPGIVLDPFIGSGTVAYVARKLGRRAVGIDLNAEYLELAARRLQQQSLFAETAA